MRVDARVKKWQWLLALVIAACGPSAAEIRHAQQAEYAGNGEEIFAIIQQAAEEDYQVADARSHGGNLVDFELITQPQWYNPEGGRESAGAGDFVQLVDRSVQLSLIVELTEPRDGRLAVTVTPKTFQNIEGSPKPREIAPDDPTLPPWVTGRVESLQMKIYERLKRFQAP
jgi:hypothetical protein